MRTVICAAAATIFLGLGTALLLQAKQASSESLDATLEQTRPPSESLEASLEPTPTPSELQPILKAHYASADAPDNVSAVTMPITYRQVRTVSLIEPTEAAPKNPSAPPAETSRTDYHAVEASPGAAVEEDRSAAAPNAKATAAIQDGTSPQEPREEDVSPSDRPSMKVSHRRKHSRRETRREEEDVSPSDRPSMKVSHRRKHSRRETRRAQQQPPQETPAPATPASAYTATNETPFHSLGQLFSGGR
jgi:hypothetical protein